MGHRGDRRRLVHRELDAKEQLVALGLPRLPPTDDGASDVPWPALGAGGLIVVALAGVALFLLRTRPRPATA
jgi:hypothetical protein